MTNSTTKEGGSCVCGEPWTEGVIHRKDAPCYWPTRNQAGEEDAVKNGYIGEFGGYVRDESPLFKASDKDWKEKLTRIWSRAHIPDFAADAKLVIESLIAEVANSEYERGVQLTKEIARDAKEHWIELGRREGAEAFRTRLKEALVGIKYVEDVEGIKLPRDLMEYNRAIDAALRVVEDNI